MTATQNIPWARLAVEATAIVASILLAFAIDAWWSDREIDQWQTAQLRALHDEFSANLKSLDIIVQTHDSTARSLESLIAQIRDTNDTMQVTVSDAALVALIAWRTSDISTGTLDSLLSSGKLAEIDSSDIRKSLAAWPSEVGDAQEDEILARDFVQSVVVQILLGQGILEPAFRSRPLPGDLDEEVEADSSTTFLVSPELIELATIRTIHSQMASRSISHLRVRIQQILDLIDAELETA
ncbi:MAG: hypothetical protein O7D92_01860 [Proteobacteria bacterium]|nr:hypothetical protein [Pseudomonadota bacterium]